MLKHHWLKTEILSWFLKSIPAIVLNFNSTTSFNAFTVFSCDMNCSFVYLLPSLMTSPSNTYPPYCKKSASPSFNSFISADSTNLLSSFSEKCFSNIYRLFLCLTEYRKMLLYHLSLNSGSDSNSSRMMSALTSMTLVVVLALMVHLEGSLYVKS